MSRDLNNFPDRRKEDHSVADRANAIIESAVKCIDRGEYDGMKLGMCHVFRESDICACKKIDLRRYRMQ